MAKPFYHPGGPIGAYVPPAPVIPLHTGEEAVAGWYYRTEADECFGKFDNEQEATAAAEAYTQSQRHAARVKEGYEDGNPHAKVIPK